MSPASPSSADEETLLRTDRRLWRAVRLFNAADWYGAHDGLEELWHETQGPIRPVLQGILQIAVAELHLERGNRRGAMVLMGEGLGRLRPCGDEALGLDLRPLRALTAQRLEALQGEADPASLPLPRLELAGDDGRTSVH